MAELPHFLHLISSFAEISRTLALSPNLTGAATMKTSTMQSSKVGGSKAAIRGTQLRARAAFRPAASRPSGLNVRCDKVRRMHDAPSAGRSCILMS